MDTLVLSSSLFLIPINIAAVKGNYVLMNILITLTLSSWAHHSNKHVGAIQASIYDRFDVFMCYYTIYFTFMYALLLTNVVKFVTICIFIGCVVFMNTYVQTNEHYYDRGLDNWRYHKHHIAMHVITCIGCIIIQL